MEGESATISPLARIIDSNGPRRYLDLHRLGFLNIPDLAAEGTHLDTRES